MWLTLGDYLFAKYYHSTKLTGYHDFNTCIMTYKKLFIFLHSYFKYRLSWKIAVLWWLYAVFRIRVQLNPDPAQKSQSGSGSGSCPKISIRIRIHKTPEHYLKIIYNYFLIIPFYHQNKSIERYNVVKSKIICVDLTF